MTSPSGSGSDSSAPGSPLASGSRRDRIFAPRRQPPPVTFSLCVHEPYVDGDGTEHDRFGVAVTTRLVGVGTLCPFASEYGAVATQSLVNVGLGRRGVEYLADGLAVADALEALLNADDGRANRQLHGVDADGAFAFSGEESKPWFGHRDGSDAVDGHYTVAGNLLTGEAVVESVADAYEERAPRRGAESRSETEGTSESAPPSDAGPSSALGSVGPASDGGALSLVPSVSERLSAPRRGARSS